MKSAALNSAPSLFSSSPSCQEYLKHLRATLDDQYSDPSLRQEVMAFAESFFSKASADDVLALKTEDWVGVTVGLYEWLRTVNHADHNIRVYNANLGVRGWHSNHSVAELILPDSPFLVDSVRLSLNRAQCRIFHLFNNVIEVEENKKLSIMHIQFVRQSDQVLLSIQDDISLVLNALKQVVHDFEPMMAVAQNLRDDFAAATEANAVQAKELLDWMMQDNFTFVGYRQYEVNYAAGQGHYQPVKKHDLGLVKVSQPLDMLESGNETVASHAVIEFAQSGTASVIHRPAYYSLVIFRELGTGEQAGKVLKEHRFMGHYTWKMYNESVFSIPSVSAKASRVIKRSKLDPNGHDGKRLRQLLEVFPRHIVMRLSEADLFDLSLGVLLIQERSLLRMFSLVDPYGRFFECLVYTPRDTFNTALRVKFQTILEEHLPIAQQDFTSYFSESLLTRVHMVAKLKNDAGEINVAAIEERMRQAARQWEDDFIEALLEAQGETKCAELGMIYDNAFPAGYKDDFSGRAAAADIPFIHGISADAPLNVNFYRPLGDVANAFRIKLFHHEKPIDFSNVLPYFENMGMNILLGQSYLVHGRHRSAVSVSEFQVVARNNRSLDLATVAPLLRDMFFALWESKAENDALNQLVLNASLSWRQVSILRAIARYLKQLRSPYDQSFMDETLVKHPELASLLVDYFECRFNPVGCEIESTKKRFMDALDKVNNYNQYHIFKLYEEVISAVVRTNYYQLGSNDQPKSHLSLKIKSSQISIVPKPVPYFEIFVYSPMMEGVHLRGGAVARGGLRWSDRVEDFRTEVLGLVKAQQVKNAIIVPVGAKGGFICKRQSSLPPAQWREEGVRCYQTFIRGLLDVTDNLVAGEVVPPKNVIRFDDDDPYLVVAADKGTATFSDIANQISAEYDFWLGDAFASGGSAGYDHKKMGITAKGGWVSVQRHFREMGVDIQTEPFTVVGIGDMAGDVFGNGMLLSKSIKLIAAFNHVHIFVDPDPDPAKSYEERARLFAKPGSAWTDYDPAVLSDGAGIYERSAKQIVLSEQAKKALNVSASKITPNELIRAILKAPVGLLWNGGIGTYVKAESETHADVGDKTNDSYRINGAEVGAKVVGEGGNLGFTQLGRLEYAQKGGRLNTDFIDNAGGVNCSDNEVNIKILLRSVIANGDLTLKQRDQLLLEMTETVSDSVLYDNVRQTLAISVAESDSHLRIREFERYIRHLSQHGLVDRELEFLPSDAAIKTRIAKNQGLFRPEIATLIAVSKAHLKQVLKETDLVSSAAVRSELYCTFPTILVQKYPTEIDNHPLRGAIVATSLANQMVDWVGPTFWYRMSDTLGAEPVMTAQCFLIIRDVLNLEAHWRVIERLSGKVEASAQYALLTEVGRLMRRLSRWLVRNWRSQLGNITWLRERYGKPARQLMECWSQCLSGTSLESFEATVKNLEHLDLPLPTLNMIAAGKAFHVIFSLVEIAYQTSKPVSMVTMHFFNITNTLGSNLLLSRIREISIDNHWQSMALESFRDELEHLVGELTKSAILQGIEKGISDDQVVSTFLASYQEPLSRWNTRSEDVKRNLDVASVAVIVRELEDFVNSTKVRPEVPNSE